MKKILSIMLAVLMSVSVLAANAVPCFAVWYGSIEETEKDIVIKVTVNGVDSIYGEYEKLTDDDVEKGYTAVIDFEYTGDSTLLYWEFNGLVEGKDYIILEQDGNIIRIAIINKDVVDVWANAVTEDPNPTKPEETTENISKKPNRDRTSPDTGAGVMAASVASIGVGVALLTATRKRK